MNYFLAKSEPGTYSIEDLERDGATVWDGVTNPQALRAIRQMKPGDTVFIYHSGKETAVVGVAKVTGEPRPDPKNPKSVVVDLSYTGRVSPPVTLAQIKESGKFNDWELVRQSRLSTMVAPQPFVAWMKASGHKIG
jgi:predicted RNA-binding protein with PUA-like domain